MFPNNFKSKQSLFKFTRISVKTWFFRSNLWQLLQIGKFISNQNSSHFNFILQNFCFAFLLKSFSFAFLLFFSFFKFFCYKMKKILWKKNYFFFFYNLMMMGSCIFRFACCFCCRSQSRYVDLEKPKKKKPMSGASSLVSIPNTIKLSMLNSGLLSFGE